jgi:hypothetical protein
MLLGKPAAPYDPPPKRPLYGARGSMAGNDPGDSPQNYSHRHGCVLRVGRATGRSVPLIQSEGESWAKFLDLIVRHGKGQMVVVELFRRPVGESRVRPHTIVIVAPRRQQRPRFVERGEQRLVQELIT